ncbi:MAG: DUF262 domain-containing protein [Nostocaceae cyanobacterium]|nr:DUF262 domain-containing protein [Nostocaceae cyanobacterium]
MAKVSLDALIPREAFEVQDRQSQNTGRNIAHLAIRDLEKDSFFFPYVRKPDFQRETNEWDEKKICEFIESFLDGDLIPAVILWRSASSYTFVIDGSHRLSALAAWINDDYGDGDISKKFYDGSIPDDQQQAAEDARRIINNKIGSFRDYQLATQSPDKVEPKIIARARNLGTLAIQLQWVEGDASKAEASFFKINQQAAPIDETELRLLKARKKPNGVAARAIMRSGNGHKYWSAFFEDKQNKIEDISKDINEILFHPKLQNPIKTLDLPVGGKNYSSDSLTLILEFINIVNKVNESKLEDDLTGEKTIQFLKNCRKIARRINSNHPSSLGLHPVIYFYSSDGRHKIGSFYAVVALMLDLETKNYFDNFTQVRSDFESIIWQYEYFVPEIVRKYRSAIKGYKSVKDFYLKIIDELLQGTDKTSVVNKIIANKEFSYLTIKPKDKTDNGNSKDFSRETKSAAFIREALSGVPKCKICSGYLHVNSISIDHIKRKADGGLGTLDNAQLTHPYCNTTVKN